MYRHNDMNAPEDGRLRPRKVSGGVWFVYILACGGYLFIWNDWACTIGNKQELIAVCVATIFLVVFMTYVYLFIRYPMKDWIFRKCPPENSFSTTLWRLIQVFWPIGLLLLLDAIAGLIWHLLEQRSR